jgi:hypothetical protein
MQKKTQPKGGGCALKITTKGGWRLASKSYDLTVI